MVNEGELLVIVVDLETVYCESKPTGTTNANRKMLSILPRVLSKRTSRVRNFDGLVYPTEFFDNLRAKAGDNLTLTIKDSETVQLHELSESYEEAEFTLAQPH